MEKFKVNDWKYPLDLANYTLLRGSSQCDPTQERNLQQLLEEVLRNCGQKCQSCLPRHLTWKISECTITFGGSGWVFF